jgi:hypothetical protein
MSTPMKVNDSIVRRFASLFAGRTDVWGALHGQAVKEPVNCTQYRNHLAGVTSLGIYPLTTQGLVHWAAIDIDRQDPHLALDLMEALHALEVTQGVYLERSKGKGYHVIVLLSGWAPAVVVRRIARAALNEAGLPATTEVFPKQDRLSEITPWGNYLNLPYFGGNNPQGRRMILDPRQLCPIPLEIWLRQVKSLPVEGLDSALRRLPRIAEPESDSLESRGSRAPVIALVSGIHATGTRRPTLVSIAGYLRYRGVAEDVAVLLLIPWARQHFAPPLPDAEIEKHVRGIYRRYGLGRGVGQSFIDPNTVLSLDSAPAELREALIEVWG